MKHHTESFSLDQTEEIKTDILPTTPKTIKEPSEEPNEASKRSASKSFFEIVELFAFAACIILLIFSFLTRISIVSGTSMQNTLQHGDRLLISDLFYQATVGDIVVLQSHDVENGSPIVKRIIATEGMRVSIERDGVYVYDKDGALIPNDEDYAYFDEGYLYSPLEVTVGEGEFFALGDHRDNSKDSRYFGMFDARSILGKVYLRFIPFDQIQVF